MKTAFLTTDLVAHCLALTASSTAVFDDIHALRERASHRALSIPPACFDASLIHFYRAREHTYTRTQCDCYTLQKMAGSAGPTTWSVTVHSYAILSHACDGQKVAYKDLQHHRDIEDVDARLKGGYQKIFFYAAQTKCDCLGHFWVDTCCIDKANNTELSEAINSMFRWYQNAKNCYVYPSDVEQNTSVDDSESSQRWKPAFRKSRWFIRGWTLQELLAPASVTFHSREGKRGRATGGQALSH